MKRAKDFEKPMEFLVDVNVAVFNHAPFLRQTLESVINQKTNFPVRLIIGDDCSTDGSQQILQEYESEYPDRIYLILQPKNLGLQAEERNGIILLRKSTSKYIALLDGDDYWTDPYKLQKQVDFLEGNPEFNACFHNVKIHSEDGGNSIGLVYAKDRKNEIALIDLANGDYMHTCSLLFRNLPEVMNPILNKLVVGDDDSIGYCLLVTGKKAKYLNEVMAAYRKHLGGVWSLLSQKKRLLWTMGHQQATIKYYNDDILSPILKKRLKASSIVLMKMAIRKVDPILFLKGLKFLVFG